MSADKGWGIPERCLRCEGPVDQHHAAAVTGWCKACRSWSSSQHARRLDDRRELGHEQQPSKAGLVAAFRRRAGFLDTVRESVRADG